MGSMDNKTGKSIERLDNLGSHQTVLWPHCPTLTGGRTKINDLCLGYLYLLVLLQFYHCLNKEKVAF